jgi:hypothetical protein
MSSGTEAIHSDIVLGSALSTGVRDVLAAHPQLVVCSFMTERSDAVFTPPHSHAHSTLCVSFVIESGWDVILRRPNSVVLFFLQRKSLHDPHVFVFSDVNELHDVLNSFPHSQRNLSFRCEYI